MTTDKRIELDDIWNATDGGRRIIEDIYPQSIAGFEKKQNFRIRSSSEDPTPSACVFMHKDKKFWMVQDKGGGDNKARNGVQLVMELYQMDFISALQWCVEKYIPSLANRTITKNTARQPKMEKAPLPLDEIQLGIREGKKFTEAELKSLGYKITQEHCNDMGLIPLDYYITSKKNGDSWVISSTENYPILFWDYGDWGKIYQPFGEVRFMYYGKKPEGYIFSDVKTRKAIDEAYAGRFPDYDEKNGIDERIQELIICSGGSDALNVHAAGYHVCWPNGETESLNVKQYRILSRIAKTIYICYDQDNTGMESMYKVALRFLDINVIYLPDNLNRFKTYKGGTCKDAKDYFVYYRDGNKEPRKGFRDLVKIAQPLKFWSEKKNAQGKFMGYDINNECLYGFLQANWIYCLNIPSGKRKTSYIQIHGNIVDIIAEEDFQKHVNDFLISWLKNNPEYYDIGLLNSIHRSNQVKLSSLDRLKVLNLDFKTYDRDFDFVFFQNKSVIITKDGYKCVELKKESKYVLDLKIIKHDFVFDTPAFDVEYSAKYVELREKIQVTLPGTAEHVEAKNKLDSLPEIEKYELIINDKKFSWLKYVYNTGRVYWKKEDAGRELSQEEQLEHDLHFISKVASLGYQMFRYKEAGQAYMVYCMETEVSQEGKHLGGTGKSILLKSIGKVRNQYVRDGQSKAMDDVEKLFDGVQKGKTEHGFIDDVKETVDLHRFMPKVTGDFEVRSLYSDTQIIPFEESPKMGFTSNHGIKKFDSSLRRRTWFNAFSDYYHPEDRSINRPEKSPLTEFGKNLLTDYTSDEMNRFYNFMLQCIHVYLKFRCRINPPMEAIERRTIQREITDEFIWWAEEWFTTDRLNVNIDRQEAYDAYQLTIPEKYRNQLKMNTFKERLRLYCQFATTRDSTYEFNPADMFKTETERKRGDIREYRNGKDVYCFHVRVVQNRVSPAPPNAEKDPENFDGGRLKETSEDDMPF